VSVEWSSSRWETYDFLICTYNGPSTDDVLQSCFTLSQTMVATAGRSEQEQDGTRGNLKFGAKDTETMAVASATVEYRAAHLSGCFQSLRWNHDGVSQCRPVLAHEAAHGRLTSDVSQRPCAGVHNDEVVYERGHLSLSIS
jgi:hypothetical protein